MENNKFEKIRKMSVMEFRTTYTGKYQESIIAEMTLDQLMDFTASHGGAVFINYICKNHQLPKDFILNTLLKDKMFSRRAKIWGSDYSIRESAAHCLIREQLNFDKDVLHSLIEVMGDDGTKQKIYDFVKKL